MKIKEHENFKDVMESSLKEKVDFADLQSKVNKLLNAHVSLMLYHNKLKWEVSKLPLIYSHSLPIFNKEWNLDSITISRDYY